MTQAYQIMRALAEHGPLTARQIESTLAASGGDSRRLATSGGDSRLLAEAESAFAPAPVNDIRAPKFAIWSDGSVTIKDGLTATTVTISSKMAKALVQFIQGAGS